MKGFFKRLGLSLGSRLAGYLSEVFTSSVELALVSVWDIAEKAVREMSTVTSLDDKEKAKAALDIVKRYAIERGQQTRDHIINLAIELLVTRMKARGTA